MVAQTDRNGIIRFVHVLDLSIVGERKFGVRSNGERKYISKGQDLVPILQAKIICVLMYVYE